MSKYNFDTLDFANELKAAGVDSRIAEGNARAMKRVVDALVEANRTHHDIQQDLLKMESRLLAAINGIKLRN